MAGLEIQGGTSVSWIYFGRLRVAADAGGVLWCLHGDALGSADLITDSAGHYASRVRQTPYRALRPPSGPTATGILAELSFLLIGSDVSGLVCQGLRWYDPKTGQFISPDPIVTGVYLIGAWNPYAYCLDNPIALCDPTGHDLSSVLEGIFTAIVIAALVVAAVYTLGTSLLGTAAMISTQGEMTMIGVAVGSFGGALAGETAAQKAGGSIILGAVFGGIMGGLTSLLGGVIAPVEMTAGNVIPVTSYIANGLAQGTFAGLGTGLAIGFAGGKGNAGSMIVGMASGAAWGGLLGTILGAGIGFLVGGANPSNYIGVNFQLKYADSTNWFTTANSADNSFNVWQTLQSLAQPNGLNGGNFAGFGPELITNMPNPSPYLVGGVPLSVSIQWLPTAVLRASGFAVAIDLSMAMDQLGFSYAQQFTAIVGIAPLFIDFIYGEFQILDPKDFNNWQNWFNQKFSSAEAS
jgi:RHS repeat-associated protein